MGVGAGEQLPVETLSLYDDLDSAAATRSAGIPLTASEPAAAGGTPIKVEYVGSNVWQGGARQVSSGRQDPGRAVAMYMGSKLFQGGDLQSASPAWPKGFTPASQPPTADDPSAAKVSGAAEAGRQGVSFTPSPQQSGVEPQLPDWIESVRRQRDARSSQAAARPPVPAAAAAAAAKAAGPQPPARGAAALVSTGGASDVSGSTSSWPVRDLGAMYERGSSGSGSAGDLLHTSVDPSSCCCLFQNGSLWHTVDLRRSMILFILLG